MKSFARWGGGGGCEGGRWVEVVGDGDRARSASANGHWPGALKPLPVLLMTRPVLVYRPWTPGCRSSGWLAGTGVLSLHGEGRSRPSLGAAHSWRGFPTRVLSPACRRHLCSRDFCRQPTARGRRGPRRGHLCAATRRPAPRAPRRAVQAWNGSTGPGGGGASLGGGRGSGGGIFAGARGRRRNGRRRNGRRRGRRRKRRRGREAFPPPPPGPPPVRAGTGSGTPHSLLLRCGKVFSRLLRPECGIYTSFFFPSSSSPKQDGLYCLSLSCSTSASVLSAFKIDILY